MSRLSFYLKRLANLNFKGLSDTLRLVSARTGRGRLPIFLDMTSCALRYQAGYMDYLIFEFYRLTPAQRSTYITRGKNNEYVRLLNRKEDWHLLNDKVAFLKLFDGLTGRRWLDLREADAAAFADFCGQVPEIVVKPIDGICGRGIEFFTVTGREQAESLYPQLKERNQLLVEQRVLQHEAISALYPRSVNTLRLVTMTREGDVQLVFSCIRLGNGKQVDNLNAGGMSAMVDLAAGVISTPAADKDGLAYDTHPLTGAALTGARLPYCAEARELVRQAALRIPGLGYVGWDVAVTQDGPLLIEANHFPGHDIYQFQVQLGEDRLGFAPLFDRAAGITRS